MTPYHLEFDFVTALQNEIKTLKNTVQTQQEAVNGAAIIIDELRKENELLKKGLYLRELNNDMGRLKQQLSNTTTAYIQLQERYEILMSKYIRS